MIAEQAPVSGQALYDRRGNLFYCFLIDCLLSRNQTDKRPDFQHHPDFVTLGRPEKCLPELGWAIWHRYGVEAMLCQIPEAAVIVLGRTVWV